MENRRYIQDAMSNRSRRIPLSSTVVWDLDRDYHFLVTGTTGSGKTKAAEYLMINLSELGYRVYYLDPKQDEEMRRFSRDCGIIYASGIEKIAQIVHETEEGNQRALDSIRQLLRRLDKIVYHYVSATGEYKTCEQPASEYVDYETLKKLALDDECFIPVPVQEEIPF